MSDTPDDDAIRPAGRKALHQKAAAADSRLGGVSGRQVHHLDERAVDAASVFAANGALDRRCRDSLCGEARATAEGDEQDREHRHTHWLGAQRAVPAAIHAASESTTAHDARELYAP